MPKLPSSLNRFINSALFRPLVIIALIALAFGGQAVYKNQHPGKYDGARKAADAFLTAYANCDAATATKYYAPFKANPAAIAQYKQQCQPGAIRFTYSNNGAMVDKLVNGQHILSIGYDYVTSRSGAASAKFLVTMKYDFKTDQWMVDTIQAEPSSSDTQTQTGTQPGQST